MSLPPDILYLIMEQAPDPETLGSLAKTCRSLYLLFKGREFFFVRSSLLRIMPAYILREAIIVERCQLPRTIIVIDPSQRLAPLRPMALRLFDEDSSRTIFINWIREFSRNTVYQDDLERESTCTLAEALRIVSFHKTLIQALWILIDKCSLEGSIPLLASFTNKPPTLRERHRAVVALYRFELLSRVFRGLHHTMSLSGPYYRINVRDRVFGLDRLLWDQLSGWEIAQMGCIHDIFGRIVLLRMCFDDGVAGVQRELPEVRNLELRGSIYSPVIERVLINGLSVIVACCTGEASSYNSLSDLGNMSRAYQQLLFNSPRLGEAYIPEIPLQGRLEYDSLQREWKGWEGQWFETSPGPDWRWGYLLWDKTRLESIRGWTMPTEGLDNYLRAQRNDPEWSDKITHAYPRGVVAILWPDGEPDPWASLHMELTGERA